MNRQEHDGMHASQSGIRSIRRWSDIGDKVQGQAVHQW